MMEYDVFKTELAETLGSKGYDVGYREVRKNNGVSYDGLYLKDAVFTPVINIKPFYDMYEAGEEDIFSLSEELTEYFAGYSLTRKPDIDIGLLLRSQNPQIYATLLNRRENEDLLKTLPHRDFLDMSLIYYIDLGPGHGLAKLSSKMMEEYGFTEDRLYDIARKNMLETGYAQCKDIMSSMTGTPGLDALSDKEVTPDQIYVLPNTDLVNGSGLAAMPELIQQISQNIGDDVYVLPSSVHEVLICPSGYLGEKDPAFLQQLVREVNGSVVEKQDQLTESIYFYDRNERTISIAIPQYEEDRNLKAFEEEREKSSRIEMDPKDLAPQQEYRFEHEEYISNDSVPEQERKHNGPDLTP